LKQVINKAQAKGILFYLSKSGLVTTILGIWNLVTLGGNLELAFESSLAPYESTAQ